MGLVTLKLGLGSNVVGARNLASPVAKTYNVS
jgi:hypothetical protein